MPMYEFVCSSCQTEFKLRRHRSDARKKAPCPECGGAGSQRLNFAPPSEKRRD